MEGLESGILKIDWICERESEDGGGNEMKKRVDVGSCLQADWKFDYRKQSNKLYEMAALYQTSQLCTIYPDISGQLCNKHIKRLTKLKCLFKDIYDDMDPEGYVLVNGVAKVIDLGHDLQLSFALQNGVSVLYSKTYKNEGIYINGNHMEQEIIFNAKGKHEDGIHQKIDQIKKLLKLIRKAADKQKEFYGGIIYVHSNIGQNLFGYQQCLLIGLTLALLLIHEELQKYTQQSLLELVCTTDSKISKNIAANLIHKYSLHHMVVEACMSQSKKVQNQFEINIVNPNSDKAVSTGLENQVTKNSLNSVKTSEQQFQTQNHIHSSPECDDDSSFGSIEKIENYMVLKSLQVNLRANHKFVFCKLDVSKDQQDDFSSKMQNVKKISEFLQEQGIGRSQLITRAGQMLLTKELRGEVGQDIALVEYCEEIRNMLSLLANQTIQFQQFIKMKYQLDREYKIYDEQVDEILEKLQANNKFIQNFCIIEGEILLISMDKQYYAELMVFLRKLINENKLSTYRFLTTMHKTDRDETKYNDISEIMFTAMPSAGYAIYTPSQEENSWI